VAAAQSQHDDDSSDPHAATRWHKPKKVEYREYLPVKTAFLGFGVVVLIAMISVLVMMSAAVLVFCAAVAVIKLILMTRSGSHTELSHHQIRITEVSTHARVGLPEWRDVSEQAEMV
jgi:hypothetical protein